VPLADGKSIANKKEAIQAMNTDFILVLS